MVEYQVRTLSSDNYRIDTAFNETTPNDSVIRAFGQSVILIEGCIFNAVKFVQKNKNEDFATSAFNLLKNAQCKMNIRAFRGDFAGAMFDSDTQQWKGFTDHLGIHPLYYYHDPNVFIVATHIHYITEALRDLGISYSLDEDGACYMLGFGYMLESTTLIQGIYRLQAGRYFEFDAEHWTLNVEHYYKPDNTTKCKLSYPDILEQANALFRHAVAMGIERDRQAGKIPIFHLSDGLDCRLTAFVAEDLGCENKLILNYSQSHSTQYSDPRAIMAELSGTFFQMPLDGGGHLTRHIDHWFENLGGIAGYEPGGSPLFDFFNIINWKKYGMNHNGHAGDFMFGSYLKGNTHTPPCFPHVEPVRLKNRIYHQGQDIIKQYPNTEMYYLQSRVTNYAITGPRYHGAVTCSNSPFIDPDFVDFMLSVPPHYKTRKTNMRIDLICAFYPKAAKTPYHKIGKSIADTKIVFDNWKKTLVQKWTKSCKKRLARVGIGRKIFHNDCGMIPLDIWYSTNPLFRNWIDDTWHANIEHLPRGLRHYAEETFQTTGIQYKLNALSLLYACKRFFS